MPNFDSWSDWNCNYITGTRTRTRNCVRGDCTNVDSGYSTQDDQCTPDDYPTFDDWSEWSCDVECGTGTQTRTRNCLTNCMNLDSNTYSLSENSECIKEECE